MYKLDLPLDQKEAARIQLRREREEARKDRIFNSRTRTIGIDVPVIVAQAEERRIQNANSKNFDNLIAQDLIRQDKIACILQKQQEEQRRQLANATAEYRKTYQTPESRREFDINDPNSLKKEVPTRISDDDPRMTMSGMQKFQGEDLSNSQRIRLQKQQTNLWLTSQMEQKKIEAQRRDLADKLQKAREDEVTYRALELESAANSTRAAMRVANANYNRALHAEKLEKERLRKAQEQEDNLTEMTNNIGGDLLTENPDQAKSMYGPGRVIPDRWKGMSPAEVNEFRKGQLDQVKENMIRKKAESQQKQALDRQAHAVLKTALITEHNIAKQRREIARQQAEENKRLAEEQRARQAKLNKEVYVNHASLDFFTQFNTGTR
eukprot:UC4_evm4s236